VFKEQVTVELVVQEVFFAVTAAAAIFGVLALAFMDSGASRRKNVLDNWVGKILASLITAFGFIFIGYAVWLWQYNEALGIPNAFHNAIDSWWLGGTAMTHFGPTLDPKIYPEADVFQVFGAFWIAFSMFLGAFIHSVGLERMKPIPLYLSCLVMGAVSLPFVSYLTWGSAGPLTNRGVHDYVGVLNLYTFVGAFSVIMAWRLGPRLGVFSRDARGEAPVAHDPSQVGIGVILLMFALPLVVLGSGFLVPGAGYFGISLTSSGFGIVAVNMFVSFIGGSLSGALIGYREKNATWAMLGPLAGYIGCGALLDVAVPWKILLVAFFGPFFYYGAYKLLHRLKIDDPKIGPLMLGPGIYGAIVAGFVAWHVHTGGFFGAKGDYALQHAEITPYWQLAGLGVALGVGGLTALVVALVCERTVGLRISDADERAGLDASLWSGRPEEHAAAEPFTA
jgi:Amt family ammonium transporter